MTPTAQCRCDRDFVGNVSIERVIDRPVPHGLELVEGIEKWNEFLESADAFVSHRSMGRFPLRGFERQAIHPGQ